MTRDTLLLSFRFLILVLIQVLILNNIHFLDYINPNLYILFIFLYPLEKERANFLWVSFLLGLSIDIFSNSGGINAAAAVCIAYFRLPIFKLVLNKPELDFKLFRLNNESFLRILVLVSILTSIHHFIIFGMEYFSLKSLKLIIYKSVSTSIFTIILSILSILLFTKKKTSNF